MAIHTRNKNNKYGRIPTIFVVAILGFADAAILFFMILPNSMHSVRAYLSPSVSTTAYTAAAISSTLSENSVPTSSLPVTESVAPQATQEQVASTSTFVATHIPAPSAIKAIYMTSWVASDKPFREKLVNLIVADHLNAVVLDIKDATSRTIFAVPDIQAFIAELHNKGIYVIGRMTTFEDPTAALAHPEWAVKTLSASTVNGITSTTTKIWKNKGGIAWVDAGAQPFWEYIADIGKHAYATGFDEINFDYVRFPSDGDMSNVYYPYSQGKQKSQVLNGFFTYLDTTFHSLGIPISADLFGETTTDHDDMGIGQILENALVHFDYVDPMVYPSHFANGWDGWKNPADHPYEIVNYSMGHAVARENVLKNKNHASTTQSTTTEDGTRYAILRPWLQDFNLGAVYTPAMVDQEMQATYAVGLNGWLMWNAGNIYNINPQTETRAISTSTLGRNN